MPQIHPSTLFLQNTIRRRLLKQSNDN